MANDWKGWNKVEATSTEMHDWAKEPTLRGALVEKREHVGANDSNIYVFEKEDHEQVSFWGNTLLDARLRNLEVGTVVGIEYLGKAVSPKTNREYHNYEVYIQPSEEEKLIEEVLDK